MTVALLFPGQGTQHQGMLPWLEEDDAARPVLAVMAGVLGADWRARLADADWSRKNAVAQPLVTGTSLAAWSALAGRLPRVVAVTGYSVGELGSSVAAGMLPVDAAMGLAVQRAAAMDACPDAAAGGLLGVTNAPPGELATALAQWGLEVAIRTGDQRCILGGRRSGLAQAAERLAEHGAKTTLLCVSVASHTSAMRAAVPVLARAFAQATWHPARSPWVAGITGHVVRDLHEVQRVLAEQVATTVRWDACMDAVAERRPHAVLEVGAGPTLTRLWRERHPSIPARSCDEFSRPGQIIEWLESAGAREQAH
jgi:[acyl-carrier-protein] S-malonyltransferase